MCGRLAFCQSRSHLVGVSHQLRLHRARFLIAMSKGQLRIRLGRLTKFETQLIKLLCGVAG